MKRLITGANGQLGTELRHLLDQKQLSYTATDTADLDITDAQAVKTYFEKNQPKIVYHCAAYTAVDAAEEEPGKTVDRKVNVDGTRYIAQAAESVGATLIYISTDYVFDGTKKGLYAEDDTKGPRNEYGRTKLAGERAVSDTMSRYYIVRTSWVFGQYGHNFVYTMLKLAKTHPQLTVVADQVGRPTWTKTLAEFLLYAVQEQIPYGTYQLSNDEQCSWYEFAQAILQGQNVKVKPVTSEEYPQKAYRPRHSVMDLSKVKATGFKIPTWQEALQGFMAELKR